MWMNSLSKLEHVATLPDQSCHFLANTPYELEAEEPSESQPLTFEARPVKTWHCCSLPRPSPVETTETTWRPHNVLPRVQLNIL